MREYKVKRVLEFKNDKGKKEYYSIGDAIIMIYEDFNDGEIEIKGNIVGIEDDGYLLVDRYKTLHIEKYYLSNIVYMIK